MECRGVPAVSLSIHEIKLHEEPTHIHRLAHTQTTLVRRATEVEKQARAWRVQLLVVVSLSSLFARGGRESPSRELQHEQHVRRGGRVSCCLCYILGPG